MSRVAFLLMLARVCLVVIDACSLIDFQCLPSCVLPRVPLGDDASLRSTTPSEPDLSTGKDYTLLMIHSISTSGLHASLGSVRCLILPHVYNLFQTDTAMSLPSKPCTAMLLLQYKVCWEGRSEEHTSELQSRLHLVCR